MNAVATLLYNPDYLPGAIVLGYTLRKIVQPNTKLVVLIDSKAFTHLQLKLLQDLWDELVDVQMLESQLHEKLVVDLKRPELAKTYLKVQLWSLPYEKVLYLDADTLPILGDGAVTDLLKLDFPRGKIVAAPDSGFPDIFNSGVFVLRPNEKDYSNLVSLVESSGDVSFDGADQGLLNQYFNSDPDWVAQLLSSDSNDVDLAARVRTSNWVPVPFLYNTTPTAQYQYLPAFNYFGPKGPSSGPLPTYESSIDSAPESATDYNEHSPALETLQSYYGAAASYFASGSTRSLVKLLHFIGPLKPWKGSNLGLFLRWWDAWYEYSGGRLIADTLFKQYYSISVKQLRVPGEESPETEGDVIESVSASDYHQPLVYHAPKEYTPADLCDPSHYHQYSTQPETSLAAWDATVEAPPVERPTDLGFNEDLKSYTSQWDDYEQEMEKEVNEEVLEETFVEEEVEEENEQYFDLAQQPPLTEAVPYHDVSEYGFHRDQKAERVFSESSDYVPLHYLLIKSEQASAPTDASLYESDTVDGLKNLEISDLLEDTDGFDEVTEVEKATYDDVNTKADIEEAVGIGFPKLFPWEFRDDGYIPEREF